MWCAILPNLRCPRKHCQCNISDASNLRCGPTRDATCLSQYVNLLNRSEADRAVEDDSARLPSPFLPLRRIRVGTRLLSKFILGRNQFLRDKRSDEGASASHQPLGRDSASLTSIRLSTPILLPSDGRRNSDRRGGGGMKEQEERGSVPIRGPWR